VPWYQGIENLAVFAPGDDVQAFANQLYETSATGQFSARRTAMLLKAGDYGDANLPVGYYTSIVGVGASPDDVTLSGFYTLDAPGLHAGACDNFWRSAEGLTTTTTTVTWAASQAAPLRRLHVKGDMWLSQDGPPHWSSGGFIADSTVDGTLHAGTQQQYLFRNNKVSTWDAPGGVNFVFVGVDGPNTMINSVGPEHTFVDASPVIAMKPYLVEEAGAWKIVIPPRVFNTSGPITSAGSHSIDMDDVYVAREGDDALSITYGIQGKKGLLLTPAIYKVDVPIIISQDDFVILGLGYPTLVTTQGNAALVIEGDRVRVAHVLLEAGTPQGLVQSTDAMLRWAGFEGVASDIFTRVGAFSYSTAFKSSCAITRADVHVQLDGDQTVVDNTWFWHADHDDCNTSSDQSYSGNGLVVNADGVTAFGLKSEHTFKNLVDWQGEDGQVFLFQSELPYHDPDFGRRGGSGYYVNTTDVLRHAGFGVGVYIVGDLKMPTAMRVPPTAQMTNMVAWTITAPTSSFASVVCTSDGDDTCLGQDSCSGNKCYLDSLDSSLHSSAPFSAMVVV